VPSSVASVLAAAGLAPDGVVQWGTPVPTPRPGVYVIALTDDPHDRHEALGSAPISRAAVTTLLERRAELTVDGQRPQPPQLSDRLAAFWLADEVIVYIGLAGTSLRSRVGQYYSTKLGARSPHAGGWFLKTLSVLDELWVHYAACDDPATAEHQMLSAFSAAVTPSVAAALPDADRPIPFANLEWPKRRYKRHGIKGAKAPRGARAPRAPARTASRPRPGAASAAAAAGALTGGLVSERISEKDIAAGMVRFPRAAKAAFPGQRSDIAVVLRGDLLEGRWDPRNGPDRERSGVLRLGRPLAKRVDVGDVLTVVPGAPPRLD
jgi:hypothetical protein